MFLKMSMKGLHGNSSTNLGTNQQTFIINKYNFCVSFPRGSFADLMRPFEFLLQPGSTMHGFLILSPNQMKSLSLLLPVHFYQISSVIWVISGEYLDFLWDFFGMLIGPNAL